MTGVNVSSEVREHSPQSDSLKSRPADQARANMDELIAAVRKPEHQNVRGWSMMRMLYPFQDRLTRLLLRTKVAAWQLTVAWFVLSLVSYGVSAIGLPQTFLAGAIILFAAIVIDLCDGEIGRARAIEMSEEEDLRSFIKGMFLDRMCHTICTPIWPLAVGWGLYQMHGETGRLWGELAVAAGIALAAFHTACRARAHLEAYLAVYFHRRVEALGQGSALAFPDSNSAGSAGFASRIIGKTEFWVRNGKRFNFMIVLASAADVVIAWTIGLQHCLVLWTCFVLYGAAAIVLLIAMLISGMRGNLLIGRVVGTIGGSNSSGD